MSDERSKFGRKPRLVRNSKPERRFAELASDPGFSRVLAFLYCHHRLSKLSPLHLPLATYKHPLTSITHRRARYSYRMYSSKLLRRSAGKAARQTRNFSRTTPAQKIITNAPLRAKEASPFVNNKYPVVDRTYTHTRDT